MISSAIRVAAGFMYDDLDSNRLVVVLIPGEWGTVVRGVESENPEWYQDFCANFDSGRTRQRSRKTHDTLIKRRHTLRALRELQAGMCKTIYANRVLPWVQEQVENER